MPNGGDGGLTVATDEELRQRVTTLHEVASVLLADLDSARVLAGLGPVHLTGSYVSDLMNWRDLDVMVHVGAAFSPHDVLLLLGRILDQPGVYGFRYADERGPRRPTEHLRDERYHTPFTWRRGTASWQVDLTLWLHDPHAHPTAWHEALRARITAQERAAVLLIKDVWHRLPTYPEEVSGPEICTAVLDGVRTPEEFGHWLNSSGV